MIKIILGFVLALLIGAGCRWFDIPGFCPDSCRKVKGVFS